MTGHMDEKTSPFLVTTDWLAERLGAPGLAIIDATWHLPELNRDAATEFQQCHIPGAVFFDIDAIADKNTDLPHMLPDPVAFSSAVRKLGIGDGMKIVVYDTLGLFSAARVWWTFRAFGVRDVAVLDGGLPKWLAEGRPTAEGEALPQPRHFTARFDHALVASLDDVRAASARIGENGAAQIVDVRSPGRFRGEEPEPRPEVRSGHIPGSRNLHYQELVAEGRLRPSHELLALFASSGFDPAKPTIATCGSGITAAILALAAANMGRAGVAVYDGSWAEWGLPSNRPAVVGAA